MYMASNWQTPKKYHAKSPIGKSYKPWVIDNEGDNTAQPSFAGPYTDNEWKSNTLRDSINILLISANSALILSIFEGVHMRCDAPPSMKTQMYAEIE